MLHMLYNVILSERSIFFYASLLWNALDMNIFLFLLSIFLDFIFIFIFIFSDIAVT